MPEQNKPFVVTDRRKFTLDGQPRPDADPSPERDRQPEPPQSLAAVAPPPPPPPPPHPPPPPPPAPPAQAPTPESLNAAAPPQTGPEDDDLPPPLTPEQTSQAKFAYDQTADRLDTAIRATNPGMERIPPMTFDGLVQSVYMTAIMQLGGGAQPGEQPRVDLMGARQSIDMLAVLEGKTKGNLSTPETQLLESALFELRMAFLEVTQVLARSSAAKAQQSPGAPGMPPPPGRPSIVR